MLACTQGRVEVARGVLRANHPDDAGQEDHMAKELAVADAGELPLSLLACPNPDCAAFNVFGAGNLSVTERMGKDKAIRRVYCNHCQHRFSERRGSLMQYTHLPESTVVRAMKCLSYGCSVEATADICEVDARSVQRLMDRAGPRSEDFHRLQLEKLAHPPEVVELDELHAKVSRPPPAGQKRGRKRSGHIAAGKRGAGRNWVHVALEVTTRFALVMALGPRTLESAAQMLGQVAGCCGPTMPLLMVDGHLPYPAAILQVFGRVMHRRRRRTGRGRRKHKRLKPPPGLLTGVVEKVRDASGNLLRVRTRALFGRLKDIRRRVRELGLGVGVNTAHVERFNGTARGRVARLARRTRDVCAAARRCGRRWGCAETCTTGCIRTGLWTARRRRWRAACARGVDHAAVRHLPSPRLAAAARDLG